MEAEKKNILYVITKSNFGGAQKYVYELAMAAKEAGYEVAVACGGTGTAGAAAGLLVEKLQTADIPVHFIKHFERDMSYFGDLLAFFEIYNLLFTLRPQVLHVTSSKAGGIGALAGRLAFIKRIVFTSHGLTMDETWRPAWQRVLITVGTWLTMALAHHTIMISTETYDRARKMLGMRDRVSLIKNGVAPIDFIEKAAARAKLVPQLPKKPRLIGGIGELHPNKNWSAAIEALASLPTDVHLLIIGEGEEREQLTTLALSLELDDRVHLVGFIDGAAAYLNAFDIFILPSLKEGLPYVLLEAGLAGRPVVASELPGNQDIITTGETGLLVEPTASLLATSLQMLLRDEGMRNRLGNALHAQVQNEFSCTRMSSETFATYSLN